MAWVAVTTAVLTSITQIVSWYRGRTSNQELLQLIDVQMRAFERRALAEDRSADSASRRAQLIVNQVLERDLIPPTTSTSAAELMQEINHALNTPLAQIETVLDRINTTARHRDPLLPVGEALHSVNVARSIVQAYRNLTLLVNIDEPDVQDLRALVKATTRAAAMQYGRESVDCTVRVPEEIFGYSNFFLIALLLPLLQNAAEASPDNSSIMIDYDQGPSRILLHVRNQCSDPEVARSAIRSLGESKIELGRSRGERHEGVGLKSIHTLLSRTKGADLHLEVVGTEFIATIVLPTRRPF